MARYKVSGRNIYGFRCGILRTLALCIPAVMAIALAAEFLIAPLLYDGYVKEHTLSEGDVGGPAAADTPEAASIADMERMGDGFTFLTSGTVLNHDTLRAGDVVYHYMELDSGETVIARINKHGVTETGDVGIYRLPLGVWREWSPPEEVRAYATITAPDHYIDMYGEYTVIVPRLVFGHALGNRVVVWAFLLSLLFFRMAGVRRRRFAPILLPFRDPLLPRNDLECWCAATFAIWSHSFDHMEGFPLITGTRGARKQVERFRTSLAEQWGIRGREEGLRTVHELTDRWAGLLDTRMAGWDLCRATQLLGMMYLAGILKRDELDREFSRAGKVIQRSFSSWDELTDSYLEGFRAWAGRVGYDAEQDIAFRREICGRLKRQSFSPYGIPWDTDLSWEPGAGGGERTFTRRLLREYRGDF